MTDFPTSNSRRPKARKPGLAGPVIGGILVFLWAFIFSMAQSFTKVTGTANMPVDLLLGIGAGLLGGLLGAGIVWLILYFVFGGRRSPRGKLVLAILAGVAVVGAVPVSGFRVLGAGMAAETDAINAVRAQVNARRDAQMERVGRERDALRARARVELAQVPVSPGRRAGMLREFDTAVEAEREEDRISAELSRMLFDEMEAELDILARTRWTVDYGQITFTTARDVNLFNVRADRVDEISRELDAREQARAQRIAASRGRR